MLRESHKCRAERHIRYKGSKFVFCAFLLLCSHCIGMAEDLEPEPLFSPLVARRFYELACEVSRSAEVKAEEADQALTLLKAAMKLDSRAGYALPHMIKLASRNPSRDYSELMYQLLTSYVDKSADLEVVRTGLSYLVQRLNSREERERLLATLLTSVTGKNSILESEIATELALLTVERADLQTAQFLLVRALDKNEYNNMAFAKLAELAPDRIRPAGYLQHLRLGLGENPFDMKAAVAFAGYAEQLQLYDVAAGAYEYCGQLFAFLRPSERLPASVYLPWAISCYNTQRSAHKCLQIASTIRQTGRFDLLLEAIAGKAAAKMGDPQGGDQILRAAEKEALSQAQVPATELAWFYCFAAPDPNSAVEWANKAYAADPASGTAASLLAYSLVMNKQTDWPRLLIDNYPRNQIADLTLGLIQLAGGQKEAAIESLRSAVARDPGSLAGEQGKQILAREGEQYIPPADPGVVLTLLKDSFGPSVVPAFISPSEIISVQLNLPGTEFSYDSNPEGTVVIRNNSSGPLVISEDSLFRGEVRIDARIGGDIKQEIPNLVYRKIRPSSPVAAGQSISVDVMLSSGPLGHILSAHPQASLDLEFTVFLDPLTSGEGTAANRLSDIEPAKVLVKRPGVQVTTKYLQNRLDSISKGRQGQKIKSAQLFAGLLMEQRAGAGREPAYNFRYADWMPDLLKSALVQLLADDDWVVRVYTMAGMLSLPLDYELVSAVSQDLHDAHWPCRLTALLLLAKSQGDNFDQVLDWTAQYDSSELVREMAIALGGKESQREQAGLPAGEKAGEQTP